MSTPSEKLAESLKVLQTTQEEYGVAIRSKTLSRTHRERLLKHGFIKEVMKGWYVPARPDEQTGESTAWYASYWRFAAAYLQERFANQWSLSPEQSISLHAGNWAVPPQLIVRSPKATNNPTSLPHNTSLFEMRSALPKSTQTETIDGLNVFSISAALIASSPTVYIQNQTDTRVALSMIQDASQVLRTLLDGGHSKIAGRLAGAFRNIGRDKIADEIIKTMRAADYKVSEVDPFETQTPFPLSNIERSPYVSRIRLMWQEMRDDIIGQFPEPSNRVSDSKAYLESIDATYVADAYHSLSIEGYQVSHELIERVRKGSWNPENNLEDLERRNGLAARGYWQAFQAVRNSIRKILSGENLGEVIQENHSEWYREMFSPSIAAGLLKPSDLAGYRNSQVYIRRSMHVPLRHEAVRDCMPTFFELLGEEQDPAVRVVLGHFIFVYIHPYMDGNGRMGRFLMNAALAAGGYSWTVIPVEQRASYMASLEEASTKQNIKLFRDFLAQLMEKQVAS
jgi:fido (protein-threonine AMPylation protein)